MNADTDPRFSRQPAVLCDGVIHFEVTDIGPARELTPTGRIKRTRAEIQAEAKRKREAAKAEKSRKAGDRLAKKRADAAAKQLRAQARRERSQAAEMKRIAIERKRRNRLTRGRNVIMPKPETPRHVFVERLQDDPNKVACNHIVDPSTLDYEDALIARLDHGDISIVDKVALGIADEAEVLVWIADQCGETMEWVIYNLLSEDPKEEDSWFEVTDEGDAAIERMPRWTEHWDDERQPTRLGRRGRNITVIRQRCPHSGKVVVEVPKPMLRTSKDLLIAAK